MRLILLLIIAIGAALTRAAAWPVHRYAQKFLCCHDTQTFDDGSTFSWSPDYGYVASTPATDYPINVSSGVIPSNVNAGASSWDDVLKFGMSRLIDAGSRGINPTNTYPVLQPGQRFILPNGQVVGGGIQASSSGVLLLIAAAAAVFLLAG